MAVEYWRKTKDSFPAFWILLVSAWRANLEIFCSVHFALLWNSLHILRNRFEGWFRVRHLSFTWGALRSSNVKHCFAGGIQHGVNWGINRREDNKILNWSRRCLRQNEVSGPVQDLEDEGHLAFLQFHSTLLRRPDEYRNLRFCCLHWDRSYLVSLFGCLCNPNLANANQPSILPKTNHQELPGFICEVRR